VAGWFKAFGEQGFTHIFREKSKKRYIGVKKMKCDRNSIGLGSMGLEPGEMLMESTFYPLAAKEKNKRLLPVLSQLKKYFSPLAAKLIKSFCRGMRAKRKAQSAKRIIQLTLCAKRHAPCAFPLVGGTHEQKR
jgi:hypothetical protein